LTARRRASRSRSTGPSATLRRVARVHGRPTIGSAGTASLLAMLTRSILRRVLRSILLHVLFALLNCFSNRVAGGIRSGSQQVQRSRDTHSKRSPAQDFACVLFTSEPSADGGKRQYTCGDQHRPGHFGSGCDHERDAYRDSEQGRCDPCSGVDVQADVFAQVLRGIGFPRKTGDDPVTQESCRGRSNDVRSHEERCRNHSRGQLQHVPGGIDELERVVADVGVAVERLWVGGAGNDGIGLGESGEFRVVIARAVIVETGFVVEDLASVAVRDGKGIRVVFEALFAETGVFKVLDQFAATVGEDVGTAEVVAVIVVEDRVVGGDGLYFGGGGEEDGHGENDGND